MNNEHWLDSKPGHLGPLKLREWVKSPEVLPGYRDDTCTAVMRRKIESSQDQACGYATVDWCRFWERQRWNTAKGRRDLAINRVCDRETIVFAVMAPPPVQCFE